MSIEMKKNKKIVAIIPARGGSKGISQKNIKKLAGKPLVAHTILAAKKARLVDRVFVSTEDKKIAKVSRKYGAEIITRPKKLASDFIPSVDVVKHGVEWLEKKEKYRIDLVVFLQCTDIFRPKGIIDKVIRRFLRKPGLDSVFVVKPESKNFWEKTKRGYKRVAFKGDLARQKKEKLYRENTGIASVVRADLVKRGNRVGKKVDIIESDDFLSFIDIHDEFDLWLAEKIILLNRVWNILKKVVKGGS
jgi:CMP-N-acetylneuraminic acid synthetase